MPNGNVKNGKAFEYACLSELAALIGQSGGRAVVREDGRLKDAEEAFRSLPAADIRSMRLAAIAGMKYILDCEPRLRVPSDPPVGLSLQQDSQGRKGDVRDVLCIRDAPGWEIGVSCKHNHDAVKHSRLSRTIDFGAQWIGVPCSKDYFDAIRPVFKKLESFRKSGTLWRNVPDKHTSFYQPVLEAFRTEVLRIRDSGETKAAANLVQYLLGRKSFYKVIAHDAERTTSVQTFDFDDSLNKNGIDDRLAVVRPSIHTKTVGLPKTIISAEFVRRSRTTIEIQCNDGWVLSFRLHSASEVVEPSLKFDIRLKACPIKAQPVSLPWGTWSNTASGLLGPDQNGRG